MRNRGIVEKLLKQVFWGEGELGEGELDSALNKSHNKQSGKNGIN